MKKILKLIPFVCLALTLQNCEEDLIVYGEDSFIQLQNAAAVALTENSGTTVDIVAQLGSPQASAVTVNFDVSGTAAASRYVLSANSISIPAGETSGSISFTPVDNDDIDGDVDVVLTLSSSSSLPVGIGGEGVNAVSKTFNIVDDNVPCNDYVFSVTTDTYGDETFWDILDSTGATVASSDGTLDTGDGVVTTYNIPLEDGCYTLRMFDFWGDNGPSYTLGCGALVAVDESDALSGIPGLDVNTVPSPGFRAGSNPADPFAGFAEAHDFCVNQ